MEEAVVKEEISSEHMDYMREMIAKIPAFKDQPIVDVEVLPGGLTNDNYKVTINDTAYAVRVAGKGTAEYINRPAEDNNASIMAKADINPELFYYDPATGDKIDLYIDGKTLHIHDFHEEDADTYLTMVAETFNKLHHTKEQFIGKFDFFEEVHSYLDIMAKNNLENYEGHDEVMANFVEIKEILAQNPRPQTPTHNDPLPENWIVKDGRVFLIDWEYGGIGDPLMDLAAFSIEVELNQTEEDTLIEKYFGRQATDKEKAFILIDKFVCDLLWYLWALIQIHNGKDRDWYWDYGQNRFNRCFELMNSKTFKDHLELLK